MLRRATVSGTRRDVRLCGRPLPPRPAPPVLVQAFSDSDTDGESSQDEDVRIPVSNDVGTDDAPIIRIHGPVAEVEGSREDVSNAVMQAVLLYATHDAPPLAG